MVMTKISKIEIWARDELEMLLEEKVKRMSNEERVVYLGRITDYVLRLNGYRKCGEELRDGEFVRVK